MCCRDLSMLISKVPNSEGIVTRLHVLVQKAIIGEPVQHLSNNSSNWGPSISSDLHQRNRVGNNLGLFASYKFL